MTSLWFLTEYGRKWLILFYIIYSKLKINLDITVAMKCQREYPTFFVIQVDKLLIEVHYRCKYVTVNAVIACVLCLWLQMLEQIFWTWLRPWSHPAASSTSLWVRSCLIAAFRDVFMLFRCFWVALFCLFYSDYFGLAVFCMFYFVWLDWFDWVCIVSSRAGSWNIHV